MTRGTVDARLPAWMPLDTARGALADRDALAVEPRTGPNAVLTPHIAGSRGGELARLGAAAVDEVLRVAAGPTVAHPVEYDALSVSA